MSPHNHHTSYIPKEIIKKFHLEKVVTKRSLRPKTMVNYKMAV